MADITHDDPLVTESKLTEFYNDIKPFLGCPAYVTQEGDAEYYSTDEKVVGRWIDGKPLYQKMIIPSFTGSSSFNVSFDTNAVIKYYEGFVRGESNQWFPINCTYVKSYVNNDNVAGMNTITIIGDGGRNLNEGFVTALYTKTTDSAATTTEQKPTHYSTDEQVVGTWIDGKPIYQKTFTNLSITIQGTWIAFNHNISNFDDLIQVCSCNVRREGQSDPWIHSVGLTIGFDINKTQFEINSQIPGTAKLTIQYTKTTD